MLYIVHNSETKTSFTTTDLDPIFNELKSGTMEIVDEIDSTYLISYPRLAAINDCLNSLWEIKQYKDNLTKEEIIVILERNLHQIDFAINNIDLNQI